MEFIFYALKFNNLIFFVRFVIFNDKYIVA